MRDGDSGRSHLLPLLAIGAIATAGGIALGLAIDWFPTAASEEAGPIDTLWDVLLIVSVPIFVLTQTIVLYSVWRFRMRPGEELKDGPPIHGNTRLEVIWTAIPAIILVALCSYAYVVLRDIEEAEASEMKVRVVGEQFTWTFYYTGDGGKEVASNQLYLPKGKQVRFDVQSKDVLHDFWVPAFRQKIDAVPGITTQLPHQADEDRDLPGRLRRAVRPRPLRHAPERPRRRAGRVRQVARRPARQGPARRRAARRRGGRRRRRRGPRRQGAVHERAALLRVLPHALRRERDRHHRPQPRRGPQGQGRGLHPGSRSRIPAPRSRRASRTASCPTTTATPSSRRRSRR